MVNLNGNIFLFKSFKPISRDSGKMVCDFARVDMAFLLTILDNVKLSFFNIQISHVVQVKDGKSYWQFIALLIFQTPFQRF